MNPPIMMLVKPIITNPKNTALPASEITRRNFKKI